MSTSNKNSLSMSAAWLIVAKTLSFVVGVALPLILVRTLDQTEFGHYKQAFMIVTTAMSLLQLGFGHTAFYYLPRETERARRGAIVLNVLLFYSAMGLMALLTLWAYPRFVVDVSGSETLATLAPWIGFAILFYTVSTFFEVVAVANQEVRIATAFIVSAEFIKTLAFLLTAMLFPTVKALLIIAVLHGVIQTLVLIWYCHSRFGPMRGAFSWRTLGEQLSYALPIGTAGLLNTLLIDMHNYVVSVRFGAQEFAIYAVGCFALPLVNVISGAVGSILIPRVSYLQKQGALREMVMLVAGAIRKLALLYLPLFAFMVVMGHDIIELLFTAQYRDSYAVFVINITLILSMLLIADPIMRAFAEHRFFLMKVRSITLVLQFVALWTVTAHSGLVGAITVMAAFSWLDRMIEAGKAWSIIGVRWQDIRLLRDVMKIALACLFGALATHWVASTIGPLTPFARLVYTGLTMAGVYFMGILLMRVPTASEQAAVVERLSAVTARLGYGGATTDTGAATKASARNKEMPVD